MRIGPYALANNLVVAPMAGVTDRPFRQLCKRLGAGYAVFFFYSCAIGAAAIVLAFMIAKRQPDDSPAPHEQAA